MGAAESSRLTRWEKNATGSEIFRKFEKKVQYKLKNVEKSETGNEIW